MRPVLARRLDPDAALGLRLTLAAVAVLLLAVPFGLLLVGVESRWAPLAEVDHDVAADLNRAAHEWPLLVDALQAVSWLLGPATFRVAAVVVAWRLWRAARRRLAAWLLVTVFGGWVLGHVMKVVVGRPRPALPEPVADAPGLSFPSGHALGVTIGVGALIFVVGLVAGAGLRRRLSVLGTVVVAVVCFARVGLGVHFVSDVVAGVVLGLAWLAATAAAFRAWLRHPTSV